jgi:uncharacterized protein (DUF362 family)
MRRPTKGSQSSGRVRAQAAKSRVVIAQTTGNDKFSLLTSALKQAGFWERLETARRLADAEPSNFRILIKPDLELFNPGDPTGTDPELVEHLLDLLYQRNYRSVAIGDARNVWDFWLENRDVSVLAELVGYHFITKHGHPYDVVDLSEETVDAGFPPESVLRGTGLAKQWMNAQFRINFAKNKTHEEFGYALCVYNLLGILPLRDKEYHYRHRLKRWDVCADVLKQTPVHFNIIDAFVSNDGSEGTRAAHPLETRTIIASPSALLADWAASLKMQIDPYISQINAKALRDIGLPKRYEILGDLSPYQGWKNIPPILLESVRKRSESPGMSRTVKPWFQSVNKELFPFKDIFNDQINALAMKYLANLDSNALAFWGMVGVNYTIGWIHSSLEAFETMYSKERLRWKDAPLDINLADYSASDYEAVLDYMAPLQKIISQTPAEPNGLRWRYLDGSVLFEFSRLIHAPFRDFVARVDISKAVQSMNDYIGGACVPVKRDRAGRIIYQAERNIYLPQPNWMVLFGGKVIDVGKLEFVQYKQREQKISWRTLKSNNGSAEFDDGIVMFARENANQTRVTIVARQKFTLPLFWQVVNMDLSPKIKDFLVVDAYNRYFTQTIANFEAQYQGRDCRIGKPWAIESESTSAAPFNIEAMIETLMALSNALQKNFGGLSGVMRTLGLTGKNDGRCEPIEVDENGFRHFDGAAAPGQEPQSTQASNLLSILWKVRGEAGGFFTDLAEAIQKDLGAAQAKESTLV